MPTVKVYSTATCPYCVMAKRYLEENQIAFEDIDVSASQSAAQEMIKKSGQMGVPVIEIDGKIFVGFDRAGMKAALGL
ncbi:MAG: glutaredoxin domain-containing protein [Candidatus Margulisiibacteriota bacterium]